MSDPLDTHNLLRALPNLLPRSTTSPLPHPTDVIVALVHTIHTCLDFRLQPSSSSSSSNTQSTFAQSGQDTEIDIDDTASETPTAVEQDQDGEDNNVAQEGRLPEGWNARGEDAYSFEYRHEQSSLVFRIRVGRMGGRVQIDAMAEDGAPHTVSVVLADLVTPPAFPMPSSATASSSNSSTASPDSPAKSLGFKSIDVVRSFVAQYKRDIIAKILPGLRKAGYSESSSSSGTNPRNPPPAQPRNDPQPARSNPLLDPLHPSRDLYPGQNPASVGRRDLDPLGGFAPPGSFNPQGDGGGMYVDFNHPLFDSRRRPDLSSGPGGSIQPPGARWDPVGPSAGGPGRFPGVGGNPLNGIGRGDAGWGDEMPPPGEFGPDLGMGGIGGPLGGRGRGRGGGGTGGLGGFGGLGGNGGGRFGGGGGGLGGGGGFGGGGGMFM